MLAGNTLLFSDFGKLELKSELVWANFLHSIFASLNIWEILIKVCDPVTIRILRNVSKVRKISHTDNLRKQFEYFFCNVDQAQSNEF